jgi:hypothetical protein
MDTRTGISLRATDVTGQKVTNLNGLAPDTTVGELTQMLLAKMDLPPNDVEENPLVYQMLLDREGRHLHASERVGDALQSGDKVTVQPNIDAGGSPKAAA